MCVNGQAHYVLYEECNQLLNQGQTPVTGMDQPIYTIGKQIQWKWRDTNFSEDKFVLVLGALHIEFVIEAVEGKMTEGS